MIGRLRGRGTWREQLAMLGVALTDFSRNNCHYVASGIAYWGLFSLFPLALAGIAILGYVYSSPEEQRAAQEAGLADLLIGKFVLPFEGVSLLLLAAVIGALVLVRPR